MPESAIATNIIPAERGWVDGTPHRGAPVDGNGRPTGEPVVAWVVRVFPPEVGGHTETTGVTVTGREPEILKGPDGHYHIPSAQVTVRTWEEALAAWQE